VRAKKTVTGLTTGRTDPQLLKIDGVEHRGAILNVDTKAVQAVHKDPSGVTSTAHETFHGQGVQNRLSSDELQAQDKPTNETGVAGQFGDAVAAEQPDLTEEQAEELLNQLLQGSPLPQ
jgi:hypothetical protein